MLTVDHTPPELLTHPVVDAVVMKFWKDGMAAGSVQDHGFSVTGHFDALSTPRCVAADTNFDVWSSPFTEFYIALMFWADYSLWVHLSTIYYIHHTFT